MAEGGRFTEDDIELMMEDISHGDDDDDQEVNTTQPFQPGAASTPAATWHGGEQHEMQTRMHKQSGLPSYDETTPLKIQQVVKFRQLMIFKES